MGGGAREYHDRSVHACNVGPISFGACVQGRQPSHRYAAYEPQTLAGCGAFALSVTLKGTAKKETDVPKSRLQRFQREAVGDRAVTRKEACRTNQKKKKTKIDELGGEGRGTHTQALCVGRVRARSQFAGGAVRRRRDVCDASRGAVCTSKVQRIRGRQKMCGRVSRRCIA